MAFQAIPKRQYYLSFLAASVAVSSYGIIAGKPVLQSKFFLSALCTFSY